MKEVEILVEVESTKEEALAGLQGLKNEGVKQLLDIYFFDPLRQDLKPHGTGRIGRVFRLRKKREKAYMTYKEDTYKGDEWLYADEFETEVGDFEVALEILKKLGFEELIRINNERHFFTNEQYEVVLEDIENLGLFMEVECLKEIADDAVDRAREDIRTFLKTLSVKIGRELNDGKPMLMLKKLGKV